MHSPRVYIVILNYLQWEDARDCLESVLLSAYTNFSVLLVDNDSGNRSLERLVDWLENSYSKKPGTALPPYRVFQKKEWEAASVSTLPKLSFIQNDSNKGFAAGNNVALRMLQSEDAYTWLLNPDMVVKKDTLSELVRFTSQQQTPCIVGAEVRSFHGNNSLLFYGGAKVNFGMATVHVIDRQAGIPLLDFISGACLFTHASSFRQLGLLPEDYFLYWEETDWCYRARQQGWRLDVCLQAVCYDKVSTVIGKSYLAHYYYARNGLLFISKFRPANVPVVLFFMAVRWVKRLMTGQWGRARGVYKGTVDFFKRKRNETE